MDDDKQSQEEEVLVLKSIFEDEDTFMPLEDSSGGSFYANIQLPADCLIRLNSPRMIQQARGLGAELVEEANMSYLPVMFLPPIELNFHYPSDYPSESAPNFTLSSKWLSVQQLNKLCKKLDEIWESQVGEVIIYAWTEFLKNETLSHLGLVSPLVLDTAGLPQTARQRSQMDAREGQLGQGGDETRTGLGASGGGGKTILPGNSASVSPVRAMQDIAALPNLLPAIIGHDRASQEHAFLASFNECGVCFDSKLGADCLRFAVCRHVYCKACMTEHFSVKIRDGDVKGLVCPENGCDAPAQATQVKELVEPELYEKYDKALLELSLSEMEDIVYCPRVACQTAVVKDDGNMGHCPNCRLAFCILCKNTYHGIMPCKVSADEYQRIKEEYDGANDDEKSILEQRYGKKTLRQVIENCNSEEWIRKHSKECPNCSRAIQKFDGCNKMTCTKCRCYFCWLCHQVLPRSDPYGHYRGNGECANRLFAGLVGEGGDGEEEEEEDDEHDVVDVVNLGNWWEFV